MASPSTVLTRGLGSWGTVNEMVTLGYGIEVPFVIPQAEICVTMIEISVLGIMLAETSQLDVTLYETAVLNVTMELPEC